jgi:hypothetical protein
VHPLRFEGILDIVQAVIQHHTVREDSTAVQVLLDTEGIVLTGIAPVVDIAPGSDTVSEVDIGQDLGIVWVGSTVQVFDHHTRCLAG